MRYTSYDWCNLVRKLTMLHKARSILWAALFNVALEAATGQILLQRTADGLILTEEGAAIVPLAEQMEEPALGLVRRLAERNENSKEGSEYHWRTSSAPMSCHQL